MLVEWGLLLYSLDQHFHQFADHEPTSRLHCANYWLVHKYVRDVHKVMSSLISFIYMYMCSLLTSAFIIYTCNYMHAHVRDTHVHVRDTHVHVHVYGYCWWSTN